MMKKMYLRLEHHGNGQGRSSEGRHGGKDWQ